MYPNMWTLYIFMSWKVLLRRFRYIPRVSFTSSEIAYLHTTNSFQNKELYKSFDGVWHPDHRCWTIPQDAISAAPTMAAG